MKTLQKGIIMTENVVELPTPAEKKPFFGELAKGGVGLVAGTIASMLAEKAFEAGMVALRNRKLK
jgi:hypothetical protein